MNFFFIKVCFSLNALLKYAKELVNVQPLRHKVTKKYYILIYAPDLSAGRAGGK